MLRLRYDQETERRESIFYGLNPSSKFIWLISFSLSLYMIKEIILIFFVFIITLFMVPLAKLKYKDLKNKVSYLIKLQIISTALSVFGWYQPGVEPLFYTFPKDWPILRGGLPIHRLGLYYSFRNPMVIAIVLISALIFIMTTDPAQFATSLNHQMKIPIRVSQCIIIGMNFVPIIQKEMEIIREAQLARGEKLFIISTKKSFKGSVRSTLSFLTTLIIVILRKVDNLSISLDKRGLGLYKTRTEETVEWKKADSLIMIMVFLFPILILLYNFKVIAFKVPSVFNLAVNLGIFKWVEHNQWIFIVFLFSFCIYVIFFIFSHRGKFNKKNKKKEGPMLNDLPSYQELIKEKRIKEATTLLENLNDEIDIPITAGFLKTNCKLT